MSQDVPVLISARRHHRAFANEHTGSSFPHLDLLHPSARSETNQHCPPVRPFVRADSVGCVAPVGNTPYPPVFLGLAMRYTAPNPTEVTEVLLLEFGGVIRTLFLENR